MAFRFSILRSPVGQPSMSAERPGQAPRSTGSRLDQVSRGIPQVICAFSPGHRHVLIPAGSGVNT
jgi:hypothetical protein